MFGRRSGQPLLGPLHDYVRQSFVVTPLLGIVGGIALAVATSELDNELSQIPEFATEFRPIIEPSRKVIDAVGPAMLTFLGVVFSITLVALQMAASQLSPRVVRLFVRSRMVKATLAVFIGTFVYTITVQYSFVTVSEEGSLQDQPFIPLVSGLIALLLTLGSVGMFVGYVHSMIRLMRLTEVIDMVTAETRRTINAVAWTEEGEGREVSGKPLQSVYYEGKPGAVRTVNVWRLVRLARKNDAALRLVPKIGDFVAPGTPLLHVHGRKEIRSRTLRKALGVGPERTMYQDIAFGFRQLVDIAIRALSPGVNDPTTAVQALDRIHALLSDLLDKPLGEQYHRDRDGVVRLVEPLPGWDSLIDLAFTEILLYGVTSPQVTRRMVAALIDLVEHAPEDRRATLERHLGHVREAVEAAIPDEMMRTFGLTPDRQGIG
ncbi:hypothetical protein GCM10012275_25800 [Longimycelium tulufanense]|uniref:DUF2254 domain-containing protein n=1 Tax=Longimycelium tulufanense TaxID=907463 RepID=A0A8J3CB76_9PSEU|nr:hypothetical protein GCM10012275_25800 [Longimycelium tulufanense]